MFSVVLHFVKFLSDDHSFVCRVISQILMNGRMHYKAKDVWKEGTEERSQHKHIALDMSVLVTSKMTIRSNFFAALLKIL